MDANKLVKLKVIGYQVRKVCGNCVNAVFNNQGTEWGTCSEYQYSHQKHSDDIRQLSINRYGSCENGYVARGGLNLAGFQELLEP